MWLLSLRDLQWRRRRFLIAIVATSLIFALTLLVTGTSKGIYNEVGRIVSSFDADRWVVDEGATGPFTSARPLDEDIGSQVADSPGVEEAAGVPRASRGVAILAAGWGVIMTSHWSTSWAIRPAMAAIRWCAASRCAC